MVTTAYEGDDFPEAAQYATWAAGRLAALYAGYEVTVEEGLRTRIQVRGVPETEAGELEHEIGTLAMVELWDQFCEGGHKDVSANANASSAGVR